MELVDPGVRPSLIATSKWPAAASRIKRTSKSRPQEDFDDPRWRLAQRIATSRSLGRSPLLSSFLLFVCERCLAGRAEEINEQQIGIHVFGRVAGYDSGDDNIVRNYARTLRKRLESYFASEGRDETLVIEIPRGGYVPVFYSRGEAPDLDSGVGLSIVSARAAEQIPTVEPAIAERIEDAPLSDSLALRGAGGQWADSEPSEMDAPCRTAEPADKPSGSKRIPALHKKSLYAAGMLCAIVLSALVGYMAAHKTSGRWFYSATPTARINHVFWSRLFEEKRDTFIVPADGGLVMLQGFIKDHVSLNDYATGSYRKESTIAQGIVGLTKNTDAEDEKRLVHMAEVLGNRRYTSIADLELTTRLARLQEVVPERLMIRYARDLRIDDLRTGNAILIGSIDANPWVDLFQQQLNFRFSHGAEFGGSGIITNRCPLPGEHASYASERNDPFLRTYGVIAYVPNLDGTGHVLMIEGINMAGTQAAGAFLLSPELMQPVLKRAMSSGGVVRPFEVLFETSSIAASASRPTILSIRIDPN